MMLRPIEKELVNERKFTGTALVIGRVRSVLEAYCSADDWYAAGTVNSIYFDTPGLSAYHETENGDNIKSKVRLRWYGTPGELRKEVTAFIEVKNRLGGARRKSHQEITAPRDLLLDAPLEGWEFADFFFDCAAKLGLPLSHELTPVCCISYSRRRYFDTPTRSRVALDWNIRAERFNHALFPWAAPVRLGALVCEFKNAGGIPPEWSSLMMNAGLRLDHFSKYGECMSRLLSGGIPS